MSSMIRRLSASAALSALAGACAGSPSQSASAAPQPAFDRSTTPPSPDPRVGLKAGWMNAGEAIWNLRILAQQPPSEGFINPSTPGDNRLTNSDLTFVGNFVIQANYSGWQVWDVSNPAKPTLKKSYVCRGSQSDVSVYRHLLFVSGEELGGRLDCGLQGIQDSVSHHRLRGIRIFDISDITNPRYIGNVQTCRGSHTHTVVEDLNDPSNVYIYVSGSAPIRSPSELPGCSGRPIEEDPSSALFRIEVIKVPVATPERAAIVSSPRIFTGLTAPPRHAEPVDPAAARIQALVAAAAARGDSVVRDSLTGTIIRVRPGGPQAGGRPGSRGGPTQCHDITVYPAIGLAGGACGGYGLLLDIRDPANPRRIGAVADSNFAFWHSATFSNDGSKILFTDEWGGGRAPRCRATDKPEWGANAIFTLRDSTMEFKSYYKIPAPQTPFENCVAHNGSLIPVPGRDLMVQGWYQGGISVFDWTDPAKPVEIAYHDRGPMDSTRLVGAGSWSAYWYNGAIYSSEISRGLDVFELVPSGFLTQNEIDAAELVRFEYLNVQGQPRIVWPAHFAVARAYLDQLARANALPAPLLARARDELAQAERLTGAERRTALVRLAGSLDQATTSDHAKLSLLTGTVRDLARAP